MPYRDTNNQYPIDPNGVETVKWYRISYKSNEANMILNDRLVQLKSEIKDNVQPNLFD